MIVAGRVVMKMLPVLQRIWRQMPEPKWCISMGRMCIDGRSVRHLLRRAGDRSVHPRRYVCARLSASARTTDPVDHRPAGRIQREGTIFGREFGTPERQAPKRALMAPFAEPCAVSPVNLACLRESPRGRGMIRLPPSPPDRPTFRTCHERVSRSDPGGSPRRRSRARSVRSGTIWASICWSM